MKIGPELSLPKWLRFEHSAGTAFNIYDMRRSMIAEL